MKMTFFIASILLFPFSVSAIDIDIETKVWKELNLPNRFPQTFYISNNLSPVYYETGKNAEELADFLIAFKKKEFDIDIDEDDKKKIKKMVDYILDKTDKDDLKEGKNYLINVSVTKVFNCGPCVEQKDYIEILNLDDVNLINIYLI